MNKHLGSSFTEDTLIHYELVCKTVGELEEKLRIATECMKDVCSELTHAKDNIDEQWCIDHICAALAKVRGGK